MQLYIGPLLSGVALCISAIISGLTLLIVGKRQVHLTAQQQEHDWIAEFRNHYRDFWKDPELSQVRAWISNDEAYSEIAPIITKRLSRENNTLPLNENIKLEKIDRFCALLASIDVIGGVKTPDQRAAWDRVYGTYWPDMTRQREELSLYVSKYWKGLSIITEEAPKLQKE